MSQEKTEIERLEIIAVSWFNKYNLVLTSDNRIFEQYDIYSLINPYKFNEAERYRERNDIDYKRVTWEFKNGI
jgi:hypothetical protein